MESERLQPHVDKAQSLNRRSALAIIIGGAGALGAGAIGLVVGFLSNALGRKPIRTWLRIGPAEDLDPESFRRHVVHVEHQHAWIRERTPLSIFIKDRYPEQPLALLSTCSHLGCSVNWDRQGGRFRCPCHGGVYDQEGRVLEGPPPRPLTRLEVKIEDDICFVRLPEPGQEKASV